MKSRRVFIKRTLLFVSALLLLINPAFSFGAAFCVSNTTELQSALTTATSNGEDDTVQIVQGTYNGNFTYASTEGNTLTVEGGCSEGCVSRTIDPDSTVLDGGGTDHVLALTSQQSANIFVDGLTLQNGNTKTAKYGGGLYVKTRGQANLSNNAFSNNFAEMGGGGNLY